MTNKLYITAITILNLFLGPPFSFGQNQISAQIVSGNEYLSVPYANIWISGTNYGTSSDGNGYFSISVDSIDLKMILKISSIGYFDTLINVKNLGKKIQLKQKIYELAEVKVFPTKRNEFLINNLSNIKINAGITNDSTPRMVGHFFSYKPEYDQYPFIKKIIIYTRDAKRFKFNLRIYSFDTLTNQPINELINENIIVKTEKSLFASPRPVEIDVSRFNAEFPKKGVLIGIEWLIIPENKFKMDSYYENSIKKKSTIKCYGPCLAATLSNIGLGWEYRGGSWAKQKYHVVKKGDNFEMDYFNPAISLILTN